MARPPAAGGPGLGRERAAAVNRGQPAREVPATPGMGGRLLGDSLAGLERMGEGPHRMKISASGVPTDLAAPRGVAGAVIGPRRAAPRPQEPATAPPAPQATPEAPVEPVSPQRPVRRARGWAPAPSSAVVPLTEGGTRAEAETARGLTAAGVAGPSAPAELVSPEPSTTGLRPGENLRQQRYEARDEAVEAALSALRDRPEFARRVPVPVPRQERLREQFTR